MSGTDTVSRDLGELGAMDQQNQRMERQILERAEKRLQELESELSEARSRYFTSNDAGASQRYMDLTEERGKLQNVISKARALLA